MRYERPTAHAVTRLESGRERSPARAPAIAASGRALERGDGCVRSLPALTDTALYQLMFMIDPLHGGNPKDPLASQIDVLFADRALFRQTPALPIWVSRLA